MNPHDLALMAEVILRNNVGHFEPNTDQADLVHEVLLASRDVYANHARGQGRTTAVLMACLALLQEDAKKYG